MKKKFLFVVFFAIISAFAFARITFGTTDLNSNDEVLFTVRQEMTGMNPCSSLYYAKLKDGSPAKQPLLLTCYPEQMELLRDGTVLQIRNRFGIAQFNTITENFRWVEADSDIPENSLPVYLYSVSSDGKWFCKIEKDTISSGTLIVKNVENGKSAVLCDNILQSYEKLPVKWSPDSSLLIYEKEGNIYFCNPDAVVRGIEMDEKYRKIGRGTINSIEWASEKNIVYVDDYLVYQINSKELYTIGLYSGIIGQGKAIGRFPFQFNPKTDKFSANTAVNSFVVIQNNRLFSFLKLKKSETTCDYMDVIYSNPYTDSEASLIDSYVFWDDYGNPILWQEKLPYDGSNEKGLACMLSEKEIPVLELENSGKPYLSPDGKKIAFFAGNRICVYEVNTWKKTNELIGENIVSLKWAGRNVIYVGGEKTIRKWNLITNGADVFMLSTAQTGFWNKTDGSIIALTADDEDSCFVYNREASIWKKSVYIKPSHENQNGRYRVFNGITPNIQYENALYIRSLTKKPVTKPMFAKSIEPVESEIKVALVFDCYDNADGLSRVISMLKKYKVDGTFFLNGEFIRRYPSETKQIVLNDYNVGSMFFSKTDLVNNPFLLDEDFIRRGLARNEDEFFDTTKKELSVIWHAPYYSTDPSIIEYGAKAGYNYINSYHANNDSEYLDKDITPEKIILDYCYDVKQLGGGIVPVTVGFSQGNRNDPLYNYIDILICALLDCGARFVSINEL